MKSLLGRLTPARVARKVRSLLEVRISLPASLQPLVWRLLLRAPLGPDLYYLFTRNFRREHRGALQGKLNHLQTKSTAGEGARFTLRRNVHRLEKALIMRPRRSTFAQRYIGEAVALLDQLTMNGPGTEQCDVLLNTWAYDVLTEYFEAVEQDPVIDNARHRFEKVSARLQQPSHGISPYVRDLTPLPITYDHMLDLAKRRRSVRLYEQRPVPRELIDKAIAVAMYSPTACNRQPFEFRIFDQPELIRKIAKIPAGTAGFYENFPCVVVVVGHLRAYPNEQDRHVIYIDGALAVMAFQFALEVQGLSSCCLNWPDVADREQKMARILKLAPDERPIMLVSLGYPDPQGRVPYSQKKSLDEIRSYNRA